MIKGHQIQKKVKIGTFSDIINQYKEEDIRTTKHTFFRLREKERKVFKDKVIKEYLLEQEPVLVGIQHNGNYAVFYRYNKDLLKVILDIQTPSINIVTFYIIDNNQMPKI